MALLDLPDFCLTAFEINMHLTGRSRRIFITSEFKTRQTLRGQSRTEFKGVRLIFLILTQNELVTLSIETVMGRGVAICIDRNHEVSGWDHMKPHINSKIIKRIIKDDLVDYTCVGYFNSDCDNFVDYLVWRYTSFRTS